MTQVQRKVSLLSHTQLAHGFWEGTPLEDWQDEVVDGQAVALTAIRTCYSPGKPSEIVAKEGKRYFGKKASDGGKGTDADRLVRMIKSSGHTSTVEHLSYTFAVEGVSRALLAQLTRHRIGTGFSVQSQRYVKFGSGDKSGGFDYVIPDTVTGDKKADNVRMLIGEELVPMSADIVFSEFMHYAQRTYDDLRKCGVPAEDARAVLPNAAACNLVLTFNLRSFLDFYEKRRKGNGAQAEVAGLAEDLKSAIIEVEPWVAQLFESEAV